MNLGSKTGLAVDRPEPVWTSDSVTKTSCGPVLGHVACGESKLKWGNKYVSNNNN